MNTYVKHNISIQELIHTPLKLTFTIQKTILKSFNGLSSETVYNME